MKYDWLDYEIIPTGNRDWIVRRYGRYVGVITRFSEGYSCTPMRFGEPMLRNFNEACDRICQHDFDVIRGTRSA
jgi:hypothetical protein